MTLRWLTFFGILTGLLGFFIHHQSKQPRESSKDDEFRRRQIEIQQATHTDYME